MSNYGRFCFPCKNSANKSNPPCNYSNLKEKKTSPMGSGASAFLEVIYTGTAQIMKPEINPHVVGTAIKIAKSTTGEIKDETSIQDKKHASKSGKKS